MSQLAPGHPILSPRGAVLEGGQWPRFFRRFAEGQFDYDDLLQRSTNFAAWLSAARNHYGVAHLPVAAVGYSNGANMAGAMLLRHPGIFRRSVLLRPALRMPTDSMARTTWSAMIPKPRVLIRCGEKDTICLPADARVLADDLANRGHCEVAMEILPAVGHELAASDLVAVAQFLK
jgi:phospholipase/carboxylesterase